jgi:hypothetical protein
VHWGRIPLQVGYECVVKKQFQNIKREGSWMGRKHST